MARWKLLEDHYLNGYPPGMDHEEVVWEYKELDRLTGREKRKRFPVPYFFPRAIIDREGFEKETFVCHEGKGREGDWVFFGQPTLSMQPLDREAEELSAKLSHVHPIDSLPGNFSASLLNYFEGEVAAASSRMPGPGPVAQSGVSKAEFDELKQQLIQLMSQNAELLEQLPKPKVSMKVSHG